MYLLHNISHVTMSQAVLCYTRALTTLIIQLITLLALGAYSHRSCRVACRRMGILSGEATLTFCSAFPIKWGQLFKKRICSLRSKFFHLRVDLNLEEQRLPLTSRTKFRRTSLSRKGNRKFKKMLFFFKKCQKNTKV